MACAATAEAALARVVEIISQRKPRRWTEQGYLKLKISHARKKIKAAEKRLTQAAAGRTLA